MKPESSKQGRSKASISSRILLLVVITLVGLTGLVLSAIEQMESVLSRQQVKRLIDEKDLLYTEIVVDKDKNLKGLSARYSALSITESKRFGLLRRRDDGEVISPYKLNFIPGSFAEAVSSSRIDNDRYAIDYPTFSGLPYIRMSVLVDYSPDPLLIPPTRLVIELYERKASLGEEKSQVVTKLFYTALIIFAVIIPIAIFITVSISCSLRSIASDLQNLEAGKTKTLRENYPKELHNLAKALNQTLAASEKQRQRHREATENLAHSLKTPLAIIKSTLGTTSDATIKRGLNEQVKRIDDLVDYHLSRANSAGNERWHPLELITDITQQTLKAYQVLYQIKSLDIKAEVNGNLAFKGDLNDYTQMLGNLVDNACKYAKSNVKVTLMLADQPPLLKIQVIDDGPGIPAEKWQQAITRFTRLDHHYEGHGVGLAEVCSLVSDYGGTITNTPPQQGSTGCMIELRLPGGTLETSGPA